MEQSGAIHIIKGSPREKWEEVQSIQHEPFIYIQSNGSWWAGEEEADIPELLDVLGKYRLDSEMFKGKFITINPCYFAYGDPSKGEPEYIDGPRMYAADVQTFFGNFEAVSHVFHITTNHQPTIDALTAAIEANKFIVDAVEEKDNEYQQ
jgi:hypothetical protein